MHFWGLYCLRMATYYNAFKEVLVFLFSWTNGSFIILSCLSLYSSLTFIYVSWSFLYSNKKKKILGANFCKYWCILLVVVKGRGQIKFVEPCISVILLSMLTHVLRMATRRTTAFLFFSDFLCTASESTRFLGSILLFCLAIFASGKIS